MSDNHIKYTDQDLTNIVRGFDMPSKEDHLELLLAQAKERDLEDLETEREKNELPKFSEIGLDPDLVEQFKKRDEQRSKDKGRN